jgi:outer membrane protein
MVPKLLAMALTLGLGASAAQASERAVVVDVKLVMESSQHWKKAKDALETERKKRQSALEARQTGLREKKAKLDAKRAVADPNALLKEEEALFREAQGLTQEFMKTQQGLTGMERSLTDQMLRRIEFLVQGLAQKDDYSFVFEAGSDLQPNVLYSNPALDVTKEVVAAYAEQFGDKPLDLSGPDGARAQNAPSSQPPGAR